MHKASLYPRLLLAIGCLCLGSLMASCGLDYTSRMKSVLAAMDHGDTQTALDEVNALIDRAVNGKKPEKNNLTLLLLERGTIHLANGNLPLAAKDYTDADKMLEILDLTPQGARKAAAALFSGSKTIYHSPLYEKLMVNIVNIATYLAQGDVSGAAVEARRLIVLTDYFTNAGYEKNPALSLAYALAGYALDRDGQTRAAAHLYRDSIGVDKSSFAKKSLQNVGHLDDNTQHVAVLILSGHGPIRVPKAIPIGIMLGWIDDSFPLSPKELNVVGGLSAKEMLSVIRFPMMKAAPPTYDHWVVRGTGHTPAVIPLASNTNEFAKKQWREMRPAIAMSAITRWLTRYVIATAMDAGGNAVGGIGGLVMKIAGATAEGALMAADIPDTRAWNTIPGEVFLGYVPVDKDQTTLSFTGTGPAGQTTIEVPIHLSADHANFVLVYTPK